MNLYVRSRLMLSFFSGPGPPEKRRRGRQRFANGAAVVATVSLVAVAVAPDVAPEGGGGVIAFAAALGGCDSEDEKSLMLFFGSVAKWFRCPGSRHRLLY